MYFLFCLLVLVADIFAIYKIWTSSADAVKKILWSAVVLILPLIGVIAWWFAGPKDG